MTDPTPFLATITGSSATMVAIVGGLLVARFVSIESEQEGAQQLLDDAKGRLSTAERRSKDAQDRLYAWDVNAFFIEKTIQEIIARKRDVASLRKLGGHTYLTDEQITENVESITTEYEAARRLLQGLMADLPSGYDYPEWDEFKQAQSVLIGPNWPEVWEIAYDDLITPPQPAAHRGLPGPTFPAAYFAPNVHPEYIVQDENRRNELHSTAERAKQQVEDLEREVVGLQRARDFITRPKGLGFGLIILGYFTFVGIIIPAWIMSRAPKNLTPDLGETVFWLFFTGMATLLGYMTVLALRLSGESGKWRKFLKHRSEAS
jgi:hypothetical protein